MPTTLVGLLVFITFLTPGFLHYVQRRALAPQRTLSPLVETSTLVAVSLATNAAALTLFALARLVRPDNTPQVGRLLAAETRGDYLIANLPYVLGWGAAVLAISCGLAVTAARWRWFRERVTDLVAPVIVDVSAWYQVFEDQPPGNPNVSPYVACDLADGTYLAGRLAWYSTETEETADREFVLSPPFSRITDAGTDDLEGFERAIVSAREVRRMYVTWVDDDAPA